MKGTELRSWRTSRDLFQRDVVKLLEDAGVEGIDQPTVSEWERGQAPIPDEVAALLEQAGQGIAVTSEPQPAPKPRRRKRAADPEPQPEPQPDDEPAAAAAADEPEPVDEPAPGADRAPRPLAGPEVVGPKPAVTWSPAVRSQLEKDLRVLFAGQDFLVPVPVQMPDGSIVEHQETASMPGLAQLVGFVDEFDGRVIAMNADNMAHAWAELANESPQVRRLLMLLTYGGAWRGVAMATLPVVYSIGVHHGLIPPVLGAAGAAPQRPQVVAADDAVAV